MGIHAEELRLYLAQATGRPVLLRMNDNLHSLVSSSRDGAGPGIRLSLHRMFLDASDEVIQALADFITGPSTESRRIIREFINLHRGRITAARSFTVPRPIKGTARGEHFDLARRADSINRRYFGGRLAYRIIWGRHSPTATRRQRHLTLGTWNERQSIIRIHPILDHPHVPRWFVDFVIYHEMIHIAIPSDVGCDGRLIHHSEEFRLMEQRYPRYLDAVRWEKRWLPALLRDWHGGAPLPAAALED